MKKIVFLLFLFFYNTLAQDTKFDLQEYKKFYDENKTLDYDGLSARYSSPGFFGKINILSNIKYLDSLTIKYNLTHDEISTIKDYGFLVSERLSYNSFASALSDIYHKDLPVYISTDAISHALHMSYDEILKQIEIDILIPKLKSFLNQLHENLPTLEKKYAQNKLFETSIKDIDIYLSVARYLLKLTNKPYYVDNISLFNEINNNIEALIPNEMCLFSTSKRTIDFSQFKVRGHYTDTYFPELALYFKAMIWFGRTELYFSSPISLNNIQKKEDIQRQIIDAFLLKELIELSHTENLYKDINTIIELFIGEQDNITLDNLKYLENKLGIIDITTFCDTSYISFFQRKLIEEPFSEQKILSQILMTDLSGNSIHPGMAFLLFGQRFIVDSYILSKVVFSNVVYQNQLVPRMLPSTLDILFSLGNNAAIKLLESELKKYHYSPNLNALRYLVDSYGDDFWNKSLYNIWLNSIRDLNPPKDLSRFPKSMQTAAYWQSKMISQLSSWAELRHDNLLYTKQSYTGGVICSYPYSFVDPFPKFFERIRNFSKKAISIFEDINYNNSAVYDYFKRLDKACSYLQIIAQKELDNKELDENEKIFLSEMLRVRVICGSEYDGWYPGLYFRGEDSFKKTDLVIADIHTTPTDENGTVVGWIKHAATGFLNMAMVVSKDYKGNITVFIGPVMSFYDYTTNNFQRLSDEEWQLLFKEKVLDQPDFTNLYMTDFNGNKKENGPSLISYVEKTKEIPNNNLIIKNYPNPFNPSTNIVFSIPYELSGEKIEINIYDISGKLVKQLLKENLSFGTYITEWDGKNNYGNICSSGFYFAQIKSKNNSSIVKMNLLK